jgi:hypothetical protein
LAVARVTRELKVSFGMGCAHHMRYVFISDESVVMGVVVYVAVAIRHALVVLLLCDVV